MTRRFPSFLLVFGLWATALTGRAEQPDTLTSGSPWLQRDRFPIRVRSLFMATDNQPGLTDAYAWGVGVGLGYQTPRLFNHLQLGGTAFFRANVLSSDLAARDPQTNAPNRYEVGLFDLQRPGSHALISRIEELYGRYHLAKKSSVTVGRQLPKSPFINAQDGRLSPTFAEGVSLEWGEWANTRVQVDYWRRMAPRSTVGWHGIGESIGLYPVGVDGSGRPSQYAGNTRSAGIFQLGLTHKLGLVVLQVWDTHVANVFNLAYVRADATLPGSGAGKWIAGLQLAREWATGNGGNADEAKAYMAPQNRSTIGSGRIGFQALHWAMHLNATRITAEGRFLMPREWGREPFYTFLFRERNEGFGDVIAFSTNLILMPVKRLKGEASVGYYQLPDVKNVALNKYGMPAYLQAHLSVNYRIVNGLDAQLVYLYKAAAGNTYDSARYVYNKVGMNQLNVMLNYHL
ncbi:hypothetical protein GCM10023189_58170 [Nibrella saemangeumensis]|uniref:Outer membrane porin, OprD family n=1 Tax=Nibrella saemangeumensis TaxID=1084526 RepID=A0ABP8NP53_9BACT